MNMIRRLSLIELNTLTRHPLRNDVTIRGEEVSVLVEARDGSDYRLSATISKGVTVDINYDEEHIPVEAIDEFRDYLAEIEDLHDEMESILDPMPDNDNKRSR